MEHIDGIDYFISSLESWQLTTEHLVGCKCNVIGEQPRRNLITVCYIHADVEKNISYGV